jgi:hypothetical protein
MKHMKPMTLGKQLALLPKQTVSGSEAENEERAGASPLPNPELIDLGTGC